MNKKELRELLKSQGENMESDVRNLFAILASIFDLARDIERTKQKLGIPIYREEIEKQRLEDAKALALKYNISPEFGLALRYLIMGESNKIQNIQREKVTISQKPTKAKKTKK